MSPDNILMAEALQRLPHGPEFRFVDRLLSLEPGKRGEGEYRVRGDEPFLQGHFPGNPLVPGVIWLEAIAQLAGTVAQSDPALAPLKNLRLTAVHQAKISGTARPGESVQLTCEISGRLANLVQARGTVGCTGRILVRADVTLSGDP